MGIRPKMANVSGGDRRQTSCSICRYGIFEGQLRTWSRRPLGLVHTDCAERAESESAGHQGDVVVAP